MPAYVNAPHPTPLPSTPPHPTIPHPELNTVVEEMEEWFTKQARVASRRVASSQSRLPIARPQCLGGPRLTSFVSDDGSAESARAAVTALLK